MSCGGRSSELAEPLLAMAEVSNVWSMPISSRRCAICNNVVGAIGKREAVGRRRRLDHQRLMGLTLCALKIQASNESLEIV